MFAVTDRLLLRPGWAEDAPALSRAIGDLAVVRNLSRAPWPYTLGDAEQFLALPQEIGRPRLLIFRREGRQPELIGGIGLHSDAAGRPELGYWIARPYWGRGYACEAGRAVLHIADEALRLPQVVASHALENRASARVLEKLGFVPTGGTARLHCLARGEQMEVRPHVRHRFARQDEAARELEPLAA